MTQDVTITISRGGLRFGAPLYLGASYNITFVGDGGSVSKGIFFSDYSTNDSSTNAMAVYAKSNTVNDVITISLNDKSLVDYFKANSLCDVDSTATLHAYVTNDNGEVVADGDVNIEYTPIDFIQVSNNYDLVTVLNNRITTVENKQSGIDSQISSLNSQVLATVAQCNTKMDSTKREIQTSNQAVVNAANQSINSANTVLNSVNDTIAAANRNFDAKTQTAIEVVSKVGTNIQYIRDASVPESTPNRFRSIVVKNLDGQRVLSVSDELVSVSTSSIDNLATKTWVDSQGFLTSYSTVVPKGVQNKINECNSSITSVSNRVSTIELNYATQSNVSSAASGAVTTANQYTDTQIAPISSRFSTINNRIDSLQDSINSSSGLTTWASFTGEPNVYGSEEWRTSIIIDGYENFECTTIPAGFMDGNKSIFKVRVGDVTSVGANAFRNTNLNMIVKVSDTPQIYRVSLPLCTSLGASAFEGTNIKYFEFSSLKSVDIDDNCFKNVKQPFTVRIKYGSEGDTTCINDATRITGNIQYPEFSGSIENHTGVLIVWQSDTGTYCYGSTVPTSSGGNKFKRVYPTE